MRAVFRFFVTCARGTEGALRREIAAMRIAGAKGDHGGVWFEGPFEMGVRVCLHARVAVRVLLQLGTFEAPDARSLYAGARAIPWTDWLTAQSAFAGFFPGLVLPLPLGQRPVVGEAGDAHRLPQ